MCVSISSISAPAARGDVAGSSSAWTSDGCPVTPVGYRQPRRPGRHGSCVLRGHSPPGGAVMFKRILVATDFSPGADAAWRFALDVARIHRASITLLHVALKGALEVQFPGGQCRGAPPPPRPLQRSRRQRARPATTPPPDPSSPASFAVSHRALALRGPLEGTGPRRRGASGWASPSPNVRRARAV